jgi:hypothetical protein
MRSACSWLANGVWLVLVVLLCVLDSWEGADDGAAPAAVSMTSSRQAAMPAAAAVCNLCTGGQITAAKGRFKDNSQQLIAKISVKFYNDINRLCCCQNFQTKTASFFSAFANVVASDSCIAAA